MLHYFDHAATHPLTESALQRYVDSARNLFANPSSLHESGLQANDHLEWARAALLERLDSSRGKLLFTGSGSESNYIALQGLKRRMRGREVITTAHEHDSVELLLREWEREGMTVHRLDCPHKRFDFERFESLLSDDTGLVTVQHVNSDTGMRLPIENIAAILAERNIPFHVDGVQAFGKIPVTLTNIDSYAFSAHKVGGPKGLGGLYVKRLLPSVYYPAHHEYGLRPGTVDVPGILAFVDAFDTYQESNPTRLFEQFATHLKETTGHVVEWLDFDERSPHIFSFRAPTRNGQWWMEELNRHGFHCSAGSACRAGKNGPNRMLLALGYNEDESHGLVRLSFGLNTTLDSVVHLSQAILMIARSTNV